MVCVLPVGRFGLTVDFSCVGFSLTDARRVLGLCGFRTLSISVW